MAYGKGGSAIAIAIGVLMALTLVYFTVPPQAVTITGMQVNFAGPGHGLSASNKGQEFVAPSNRVGPVPSMPFNVAKDQNLTVAWTLWIQSSPSNSLFNVTSVNISSPFVYVAVVPGFLWHSIPVNTPILEEVTIQAPSSNGNFVVTVTVTVSS